MINISIKGMTCQHCVAAVKETVEAIDGVIEADVSLENAQAVVNTGSADISRDTLVQAVIDAGYEAS